MANEEHRVEFPDERETSYGDDLYTSPPPPAPPSPPAPPPLAPPAGDTYTFVFDAVRGPGSDGVQLSEVVLYDVAGGVLGVANASATDARQVLNRYQLAPNAIDGSMETKWLDGGVSKGISTLQLTLHNPAVVGWYEFFTANDVPKRDPVSWTFGVVRDAAACERAEDDCPLDVLSVVKNAAAPMAAARPTAASQPHAAEPAGVAAAAAAAAAAAGAAAAAAAARPRQPPPAPPPSVPPSPPAPRRRRRRR